MWKKISLLSFLFSKRETKIQQFLSYLKKEPHILKLEGTGFARIVFKSNGKLCAFPEISSNKWNLYAENGNYYLKFLLKNKEMFVFRFYPDRIWRAETKESEALQLELVPGRLVPIHNRSNFVSIKKGGLERRKLAKRVYIVLSGQLGNCLRNISSTKLFADHINAYWCIDLDGSFCPSEVKSVLRELFPERIESCKPKNKYLGVHELDIINFRDVYGTNSDPILEGEIEWIPKKDFLLKHIYAVKPFDMPLETFIKKKIAFYSTIKFPNLITEKAKKFVQNHCDGDVSKFIGVHIRYTDNLKDDMKVCKDFNTDINSFVERIAGLSDSTILLCTDNEEVRSIVEHSLPTLNILSPDKLNSTEMIFQPIYEMYLLSQTKLIIGSYSSTFSYESAFFQGTDLELYQQGKWVAHQISIYRS